MSVVCVEEKETDRHLTDGLRMLARIIARDFMASQALAKDGEALNNDESNRHLQDK